MESYQHGNECRIWRAFHNIHSNYTHYLHITASPAAILIVGGGHIVHIFLYCYNFTTCAVYFLSYTVTEESEEVDFEIQLRVLEDVLRD